jgi:hypothetical protein
MGRDWKRTEEDRSAPRQPLTRQLAFKRWKSLCHFDQLPNYRDDTILAWLNAKLLLALLMHRMASGASALFPPAQQNEEPDMALDAMEGRQHSLATNRQGVAAA